MQPRPAAVYQRAAIVGAALLCMALVYAGPAHAQSYRLDYSADDGCPDAQHFVDSVVARLGIDPFESSGKPLRVEANRADTGRFTVTVSLGALPSDARREFDARQCVDGVDAAAVAFAVLFAQDHGEEEQSWDSPPEWPAPTEVEEELQPSRPQTPETAVPEPEPQVDDAPHVAVGLLGGAQLELARFASPSTGVHVGAHVGGTRVWFRSTFWYATSFAQTDLKRSVRASFRALGGSLGVCAAFGLPLVCADAEVGSVAVRAPSENPSQDSALYAAISLEAGLQAKVAEGLYISPMVRIGVPIAQPEVFVADEISWTASSMFAGVVLRLHWRIA